jgi:hypothetical protein
MTNKIFKSLRNFELTETSLSNIILVSSFVLLSGICLGLSFYNEPQAEDYTVYVVSQAKSLPAAIIHWYFGFSGRYASNALVYLFEPLRYSYLKMAFILPVSLFLLFGFTVRLIFVRFVFPGDKNYANISTSIILLLYFYGLPSIFEGFLWTPGSLAYTLPIILALINISWLIEGALNIFKKTLLLLFTCYIGGSSEVTPMIYGSMITGIALYSLLKKHKLGRFFWIHFAAFVFFTSVEFLAPGNFKRASISNNSNLNQIHDVSLSLIQSITFFKSSLFHWIIKGPAILCFGLFFLMFQRIKIVERSNKIAYGIIFIMSLITSLFIPFFFAFATNSIGMPNRVINVVYFCFMVSLIAGAGWLAQVVISYETEDSTNYHTRIYAFTFLFLGMLLSVLTNPNKLHKAFEDLYTGRAKRYSEAAHQRDIKIKQSKSDTVVVSKFTDIPYSLFLIDICDNPKDWKNDGYAKYYKKKALIAK